MKQFDAFVDLYVDWQRKRHENNPHWETREDIIENCGGESQLEGLYNLWTWASPEKQKETCGFTYDDIINYLTKQNG